MRVLVVVHGFPPAAQGGSEIYAHAHARALHGEFGDEVLVLTREQDPADPSTTSAANSATACGSSAVNNTFRRHSDFEETYRNDGDRRDRGAGSSTISGRTSRTSTT